MNQYLIPFALVVAGLIAGCDKQLEKAKNTPPQNGVENDSTTASTMSSKQPTATDKKADVEVASESSGNGEQIVFGDQFPEVLDVKATPIKDANWRFAVTLSSTYDTPQRYADAWRVLDAENQELGIRILGHDHAAEQPFTRSHTIQVPAETKIVFVEGRDQDNGWSGQRFKFEMPSQR